MEVSPFGIIYVFVIIAVLLFSKNKFSSLFLLCAVTEVFIEMGYVYSSGEKELTASRLSENILILCSLFSIKDIPRILLKKWLVLVSCYLLPIVVLYFFPSSVLVSAGSATWDEILRGYELPAHPTITRVSLLWTARYIFLSLAIVCVYSKWSYKDYESFLGNFSRISCVYLIIGVYEFVAKNFLGLNKIWGDVLLELFGDTDSTVFEGRLRGYTYELNLFTKEASHYAYVLLLIAIIRMAYNAMRGKKNVIDIYIILSMVLMVLSTSFSSLLFIGGFVVLYLIYRWYIIRPQTMKFEKTLAVILVIILFFYQAVILNIGSEGFIGGRLAGLYENFDDIVTFDWTSTSNMKDGSTLVRIMSVVQTLSAFLARPLCGYSIGTVMCHGATAIFLASVGLIGLFIWIKFYFLINPLRLKYVPQNRCFYIGILLYLLINLLNSMQYRPFYELSIFLIAISLCYLFSERRIQNM